jgi:polysaccharide biosynthesis/export protein
MRTLTSGVVVLALGLFAFARAQGVATEEYILQPGDVIDIHVVEHPEFSGKHKIRPDGRINYPVVGEVEVASLSCAELVKLMEGKLSAYINNPVVSVAIEAYYANKVYIIGSVRKAGEYQIYEPIHVRKAMAMAGGLAGRRVRSLKIIRASGDVLTVRTKDLWSEEPSGTTDSYVLRPGDTLYAPPSFQMPWALVSTVLSIINLSLVIILNSDRVSSIN